jgi:hypothetical protein
MFKVLSADPEIMQTIGTNQLRHLTTASYFSAYLTVPGTSRIRFHDRGSGIMGEQWSAQLQDVPRFSYRL